MMSFVYELVPVHGIPAVTKGDDIAAVISPALAAVTWADGSTGLRGTDIVVIAGKIVAKAQGKYTRRDEIRAEAFEDFDAMNLLMFRAVPPKLALYRPEKPDEAAGQIRRGLAARFGGRPGVIVTGSERERKRGQGRRDIALGSAGVDYATERGEAIADVLAAIGGLAMNQSEDCPVVVIRGVNDVLTYED
ncbi:MAG: coenzyme F420-0:L-glutamate ligase [Actinomycetaceae bacterium]|nr:coenzyme F420-0:L-glutamate ligase [Actinomycetaceae bacterium]